MHLKASIWQEEGLVIVAVASLKIVARLCVKSCNTCIATNATLEKIFFSKFVNLFKDFELVHENASVYECFQL